VHLIVLDLFESTWESLWDGRAEQEPVGAVFTRPEVVDLILDLAGYAVGSRRLAEQRLLEPSCGEGAFLLRVVDRLLESERQHRGSIDWTDRVLDRAIRAADISTFHLERVRTQVVKRLIAAGCTATRADALASGWLVHTDFLLHDWDTAFDLVVGNPPYVRIEDLPRRVLARYREMYSTLGDRADLYVAFLERGLGLLSAQGTLAFITANRFAKNLYGRKIRKLIADRFHLRFYVNLEHTQPFLEEVSAYPAIVVVDRDRGAGTRAGQLDALTAVALDGVRRAALQAEGTDTPLNEFPSWYPDGGPWLTTCGSKHRQLRSLDVLPTLECSANGTRVGIGVATGADAVFILPEATDAIEEDRQLPLVMAGDASEQVLSWSGHVLVNPFDSADDGSLVRLADYPKLAAYLDAHADRLRKRHVARVRPAAWYRTIDRVWARLTTTPKLLVPDIQHPEATVVCLDSGRYYPHHNLYWITSDEWDLRVLQTLLRSSLVREQVRAYSVQMRGGSLRWQAQTLRRLRLPALASIPDTVLDRLAALSAEHDRSAIDEAAEAAFFG